MIDLKIIPRTANVDKVISKKTTPKTKKKATKSKEEKSKGLIVIPYVEGLTERLTRVFKKHGFSMVWVQTTRCLALSLLS